MAGMLKHAVSAASSVQTARTQILQEQRRLHVHTWYSDFSRNRISFTFRDRPCPGQSVDSSVNHPSFTRPLSACIKTVKISITNPSCRLGTEDKPTRISLHSSIAATASHLRHWESGRLMSIRECLEVLFTDCSAHLATRKDDRCAECASLDISDTASIPKATLRATPVAMYF